MPAVETAKCSVCDGEIGNLGAWEPSPCTECDGTGRLCVANDHGDIHETLMTFALLAVVSHRRNSPSPVASRVPLPVVLGIGRIRTEPLRPDRSRPV